jgi:catechol 2,3-dioxygenase
VLDDLASEPFRGLAPGTVMGHIHLKVAEIAKTVSFYRDALGFALMAQLGPQAAFLSAGGYHHHIGANTWDSAGAGPPPPRSAALRHATIVVAGRAELDRTRARLEQHGYPIEPLQDGITVTDPFGNKLLLTQN